MFQHHHNPGDFKKIISSPFVILFLSGLVFLAAYGTFNIFLKRRGLEDNLGAINAKIQRLETENISNLKEVDYLTSESGIEKEAKSRLNLKSPGENVVVVIPPEKIQQNNDDSDNSFLNKLKSFFQNL